VQENDYFCTKINRSFHRLTQFLNKYTFFLAVLLLVSCADKKQEKVVTPWGEVLDEEPDSIDASDDFDLHEIQHSGQLILATISGPQTYYDYHGRQLGTQYLLVQRLADKIGVGIRVEICRDSTELAAKFAEGEVDIVAWPTPGAIEVNPESPLLAKEWKGWYKPEFIEEVKKEETSLLTTQRVKRHVFSPMLDKKGGVISHYDKLFMQYSQPIRWDWRLMAAQCYQESTFDPKAVSFAGAKGLMQIMPGTADVLGLPRDKMYDPEQNIAAAAKYLGQLEGKFGDIRDRAERTNFVLASYNGGIHHIRDAMALAQRDGKNPHRWREVAEYVLKLATPKYYNDPIVKHGYMRGSETVDYVSKIRQRHQGYMGVKVKTAPLGFHPSQPRKADKRKKKYDI
jgi:membrane-bound lytic murein transglycosylase F